MAIQDHYILMMKIDEAQTNLVHKMPIEDRGEITGQLTTLKIFLAEQIEKEHNKRKYDPVFVEEKCLIIKEYLASLKEGALT